MTKGARVQNGLQIVKPGEEQWDLARAAWNLTIDQRPAMVARPGNADEVAQVVNFLARTTSEWPSKQRATARERWREWATTRSC